MKLVFMFLVLLSSCADDFTSSSVLGDTRVLALLTDQLDYQLSDEIDVNAIMYVNNNNQVVQYDWSYCPISLGSSSGYACFLDECEQPLGQNTSHISFIPSSFVANCIEHIEEETGYSDVVNNSLPSLVRYKMTLEDGSQLEAVLQIYIYTEQPESINYKPQIQSIHINNQLLFDGDSFVVSSFGDDISVNVVIDQNSLDEYIGSRDKIETEQPEIFYFTTTGSFESEVLIGLTTENIWYSENTATQIYIVARDGRGGQDAAGPIFIVGESR